MNNNIKSSFDEFNPTNEQKMRMLKNIQNKAYANNVFNFKKIYIPTACAVAAAFIFFVGTGMFNNQTQNIIDTPQIVKVTPDNTPVKPETKNEETTNNTDTNTLTQTYSQGTTKVKSPVKVKQNTQAGEFEQVFESVDNNKENTQDVCNVQLLLNDVPESADSPMARNIPQTAAMDEEIVQQQYKDVTYTEFCDELGYDIADTVKVPDDMQNITQNENSFNVDTDMEWDVTFIGDGARCININTSTDTTKNDEYMHNENYKKTNVNGNEAVVFYDENYTAYMNTQNANYKITTIDINEQEFTDILTSLK